MGGRMSSSSPRLVSSLTPHHHLHINPNPRKDTMADKVGAYGAQDVSTCCLCSCRLGERTRPDQLTLSLPPSSRPRPSRTLAAMASGTSQSLPSAQRRRTRKSQTVQRTQNRLCSRVRTYHASIPTHDEGAVKLTIPLPAVGLAVQARSPLGLRRNSPRQLSSSSSVRLLSSSTPTSTRP